MDMTTPRNDSILMCEQCFIVRKVRGQHLRPFALDSGLLQTHWIGSGMRPGTFTLNQLSGRSNALAALGPCPTEKAQALGFTAEFQALTNPNPHWCMILKSDTELPS